MILRIPVVIFLFALPMLISAQVPPQYRADYNRMMKTQSFNFSSQQFFWQMGHFYYRPGTNLKYEYIVTWKDSSETRVNSSIHFDDLQNKHYLEYVNKKIDKGDSGRMTKIYCDKTLQIRRINKMDDEPVLGTATDSCWLFAAVSGKVTLYSNYSEPGNNGSFVAFSHDNGPVQPLEVENLETVIKENKKAYVFFKQRKYYKAVQKYNQAYMR